ncbi:MAG TPA: NAD(P)H-binding protein [Candidatus Acidoferrales bacterium]|nr:NAD(P)H-binding protein [Candidatus Acidoferrales bacterium]
MKIVITGANSAVGHAILRCGPKLEPTNTYVAAVRSARAVEQLRAKQSDGNAVVQISYDDPTTLDAAFQGASAVIHLAGILFESPNSTYEQANVASTRAVVESAQRAAVQKIILVSANGADQTSSNRYYRTKGQAEELVRASGLSYTVLRAPLLLGPGTAGSAALQRNISGKRAKLIGGGRNFQQPLHVDDLARAALAATRPTVANNLILEIVGPASLPEREIVELAARLQGRQVRIGSIPKFSLSLIIGIRQRLGKGGFSLDALEVITADTRLNPQPAADALGIKLTGIDEMIKDSLG